VADRDELLADIEALDNSGLLVRSGKPHEPIVMHAPSRKNQARAPIPRARLADR